MAGPVFPSSLPYGPIKRAQNGQLGLPTMQIPEPKQEATPSNVGTPPRGDTGSLGVPTRFFVKGKGGLKRVQRI